MESGGTADNNNGSKYAGLFQHDVRYWDERAGRYGLNGADIF